MREGRGESAVRAVEGVDTVGKTEDAGSTTDEEAARGVGGAIAGMNENAGTTGGRPPNGEDVRSTLSTTDGANAESEARGRRDGGRIRPREWRDALPTSGVRGWRRSADRLRSATRGCLLFRREGLLCGKDEVMRTWDCDLR